MPDLFTNTYISRNMRVILAQDHENTLQILDVSFKQGPCCSSSSAKTVFTCHPCKKVIPAQDPQYSAVDFSVIFALLGEQSRVPTFRPSQTLWAASQAVDEGATHQESVPLLHSSLLDFVPELWPWIWAVAPAPFVMKKAYTIEGSSTPRRKSSAMRRRYCSTRCARRSTSLASVLGPSTLLARGGLLGRGPFLQCSAASSAPSRGRVTGSKIDDDDDPR